MDPQHYKNLCQTFFDFRKIVISRKLLFLFYQWENVIYACREGHIKITLTVPLNRGKNKLLVLLRYAVNLWYSLPLSWGLAVSTLVFLQFSASVCATTLRSLVVWARWSKTFLHYYFEKEFEFKV